MLRKAISLLMIIGAWFLVPGCGEDDGGNEVLPPSNLVLNYTLDGESSTILNVTATASNANFYRFDFGDGTPVVENTTGKATHSYQRTGEFTLKVQAHTSETVFIAATEPINISVPDPTELGYDAPESYEGYSLVWRDEFNGSELSEDWTFELGDGCPNLCGWGNNELEYYRRENVTLENGFLYITARKENAGGRQYTSSRIITKGSQSFQYGRIDIRAILPEGQGIWPALWMLGDNIDEVSWPACGEIDIMEMIGGSGRENTVHGTVHWDNGGSYANYGGSVTKSSGNFAERWHVFSIIWTSDEITWLVDNEPYHVIDITPAGLSEFRNSFFLIFNVAVGGNWPGSPASNTEFPQSMIVDYVRVHQTN